MAKLPDKVIFDVAFKDNVSKTIDKVTSILHEVKQKQNEIEKLLLKNAELMQKCLNKESLKRPTHEKISDTDYFSATDRL